MEQSDKIHAIALSLAKEHPEKLSKLDIINFMRNYRFAENVLRQHWNEVGAGELLYIPEYESMENTEILPLDYLPTPR